MVNINCSSNCKYQIDGKCTLSTISINNDNLISNNNNKIDCAYFINSDKKLF